MNKRVSGDDQRTISRWIDKMGGYNRQTLGQYNRMTSNRRAKIARAELRLPYRCLYFVSELYKTTSLSGCWIRRWLDHDEKNESMWYR